MWKEIDEIIEFLTVLWHHRLIIRELKAKIVDLERSNLEFSRTLETSIPIAQPEQEPEGLVPWHPVSFRQPYANAQAEWESQHNTKLTDAINRRKNGFF